VRAAARVVERWGPWGLLFVFWAWKTSDIWRSLTSRHYAIWGVFFDTMNMVWMSWWTDVAMHSSEGLFETTYVNFPDGGATALSQSLAWTHVVLAGLLRGVVGGLAAHNLLAILGLGLSLTAVFLLLRHLSGERWMAALLTLLMVTYGLCWGQTLPDLELASFGYFGFALLAWLRYAEDGGRGRLILAAILVGWTGFVQMYYGLSLVTLLGMAALLSARGRAPGGVPARRFLVRTAQVLGAGAVLMAAFHARDLVNVLRVDDPPHWDQFFRFAWWRPLLLLLAVLGPIAAATRWRMSGAFFWGIALLPVAVLSMGEFASLGAGRGDLALPLNWVRWTVPLMYRITFCFRFVPPLLLALAMLYVMLWREAPRGPGGWRTGLLVVALFWCTAAFAPLVPRFELGAAGEALSDADCAAPHPNSCTLVQAQVAWCDAGAAREPGLARWTLSQVAAPALPLATVEMPPAPACVQWLTGQGDDGAVLEFAYQEPLAYSGYFQTFHQRPVVGFPLRYVEAAAQLSAPGHLTELQRAYRRMEPVTLPRAEELSAEGIGYVLVHRDAIPETCHLGPGTSAPLDPDARAAAAPDFARAYGAEVCRDRRLIVYRVSSGGSSRR
jgi:hypothetical protein